MSSSLCSASLQHCALLGLCALSLGTDDMCKQHVAEDGGGILRSLLDILTGTKDIDCFRATTYCVGSLCENSNVRDTVGRDKPLFKAMIAMAVIDDIAIKRNVAYFLATMSEAGGTL